MNLLAHFLHKARPLYSLSHVNTAVALIADVARLALPNKLHVLATLHDDIRTVVDSKVVECENTVAKRVPRPRLEVRVLLDLHC